MNIIASPNARARVNAAKTHCDRGHPFNERNTYWPRRGQRRERHCRTCQREAVATYRARRREAELRAIWGLP